MEGSTARATIRNEWNGFVGIGEPAEVKPVPGMVANEGRGGADDETGESEDGKGDEDGGAELDTAALVDPGRGAKWARGRAGDAEVDAETVEASPSSPPDCQG